MCHAFKAGIIVQIRASSVRIVHYSISPYYTIYSGSCVSSVVCPSTTCSKAFSSFAGHFQKKQRESEKKTERESGRGGERKSDNERESGLASCTEAHIRCRDHSFLILTGKMPRLALNLFNA